MTLQITAAVLGRSGDNLRPYADTPPLMLKTLTLDDPKRGELLVRLQCPLSQCGALLRELLR